VSNTGRQNRVRVLLFCTPGRLARHVLAALDRPEIDLVAIVHRSLLSPGEAVRLIAPPPVSRLPVAGEVIVPSTRAPRLLVRDLRSPDVVSSLSDLAPDLIVVGCFPLRLLPDLLGLPRIGAINVHPSLLPAHRGPDPLFWTFHAGERQTGITIHHLDAGFDTGPILSRQSVNLPDTVTYAGADAILADAAESALAGVLASLPMLAPGSPQPEGTGSYESFPTVADLTIDSSWTVRRAAWFIAGVADSHGPLRYRAPDGVVTLVGGIEQSAKSIAIDLADGVLDVLSAI
jgi:methionyl-tRNA formyltransferase